MGQDRVQIPFVAVTTARRSDLILGGCQNFIVELLVFFKVPSRNTQVGLTPDFPGKLATTRVRL